MKRAKCSHCRKLIRLLKSGKLKKHTADCDGPGFPYDCPGVRVKKRKT